ncbi:MAG: YceI family protein [Granulosicoccus sp.]
MNTETRLSATLGLAVLLVAFCSGCASLVTPNYTQKVSELRSGAYTLDPEHAYLIFRVEHLGLSTVVGRFNTVDASLDFNPDSLSDLALEGVIDVASIDLNNDDLESRLKGPGWLAAERFPEARFTSVSAEPGVDNAFVLNGEFTLRGITRPVSLLATFKGGADNLLTGLYTLGFSATGSISRSAFGIDSFAALIADEIFIEIHAEFQLTSP